MTAEFNFDFLKEPGEHSDLLQEKFTYRSIFQKFQNLMNFRIRDILLVSSPYELYLFEEDGRLYELLRREYLGLNLSHSPELTRVSSGEEVLRLAKENNRFDMIIATLHTEDIDVVKFAKFIKNSGLNIPIVLLAYDTRELNEIVLHKDTSVFDGIFIWQGDFRIIIAIIKYLEDKMNVAADTQSFGVQSVVLIENNVQFYSSYLPIIYTEIISQSQRLISEGINLSHQYLRMRARPKILLCTNYEEASEYFNKYNDYILGIISDVEFQRDGKPDPTAGLKLTKRVKELYPDIPILLQSNKEDFREKAYELGASFLLKDSPTLLHDLREFMVENFSFGDFVFRTPDGTEVGRAVDLRSLEREIASVPAECIEYHALRNHFSNWLKARTEFRLAHKLRPRKVSDYASVEDLRQYLVRSLREYRKTRQRGFVTDFKKETFDPNSSFARIGGGSLGGKARGLGFVNTLINNHQIEKKFEKTRVFVPSGVALGTDVFDQFLDANDLRNFALNATDDVELIKRFQDAQKLPEEVLQQLGEFLEIVREPLAIRSSSLMEDSQYHPFAGVYSTRMIPNRNENLSVRLNELLDAIKLIYASTFHQAAKNYMKVTSYRLEEEKMAVVVQRMVGTAHDNLFYPDFAGVARSYNFYPVAPQKSEDGVASVALGLGKTVVEGGNTVKFCPKYPNHIPQFSSIEETIYHNQTRFFALNIEEAVRYSFDSHADQAVEDHQLSVAEKHGTLLRVGSTYSASNEAIYDGLSRDGIRLVTFAPILKHKIFPLPKILELFLELGKWGMGTPIEIEFAVNLSVPKGRPAEFAILQMRPLVLTREMELLDVEDFDERKLVCESRQALGNGVIDDICDVVLVDPKKFDRRKSRAVATEIAVLNAKLLKSQRPYMLVGLGRWGTSDPWLGIPVTWDQIAGARVIVESGFKDFSVEPSQGSHFFQNLTSFMVGFFTINPHREDGFLDWDWLMKQKPVERLAHTRHLRFKHPLMIKINGRQNRGIILRPDSRKR